MNTETTDAALRGLTAEVATLAAAEAARRLEGVPERQVVDVLRSLTPQVADAVLQAMDEARRRAVLAAAPAVESAQWQANLRYPEGTVGRIIEPAQAVFAPTLTVAETVERIRELVKSTFVTYCFVTDADRRLLGVVAMRDLLLADRTSRLEAIMLRNPFSLSADLPLLDAARAVVARHFPEYPVCDADGRLLGLVRGRTLFEQQALDISAQAGAMVGVEKEERLSTPWSRSFRFRHPWLQLNLLTAFVAAAVVGAFQDTLDKLVILAVFLPVLAGQSGNTGCQALAVTLRGMTLGELRADGARRLVAKEGLLGLMNGAFVGVSAAIGMYVVARMQGNPDAVVLAIVVMLAMIGSCIVSGLSGALIPLTLRRLGADPATASSIFLTTATDVASMGLFLGLATLLLL
jgi:magnesium transporter